MEQIHRFSFSLILYGNDIRKTKHVFLTKNSFFMFSIFMSFSCFPNSCKLNNFCDIKVFEFILLYFFSVLNRLFLKHYEFRKITRNWIINKIFETCRHTYVLMGFVKVWWENFVYFFFGEMIKFNQLNFYEIGWEE